MEKIIARRIEKLNTATIKEMVVKLNEDFRDGADEVQSAAMNVLMTRLPEAEFVEFCEAL